MVGDMPASHRLAPVRLVKLADARNSHKARLNVLSQSNEAINVPSPQSCGAGPKVILLAHAREATERFCTQRARAMPCN